MSERTYRFSGIDPLQTRYKIARDNGITLVDSPDHGAASRSVSEKHGSTFSFYTGGAKEDTDFVVGREIVINAERADIPTDWALSHELS